MDALLDAGYTLFPNNNYKTLKSLLHESTITTIQVIAKHLSARLRRLAQLAATFGLATNDDASLPDFETAAGWCLGLEDLGEPVDPSIRVPMSDDMIYTVYHMNDMQLSFFPIFHEHGFVHAHIYDQGGQPPMLVGRHYLFHSRQDYFLSQRIPWNDFEISQMMPWLSRHGFLSQKPRDPFHLGLNVDITGVHRIAAEMGSNTYLCYGNHQDIDNALTLVAELLTQLHQDSCRDKCVCWCTSGGEGCSPLKVLYKSHAHATEGDFDRGIEVYKRHEFRATSIQKLLFDFGKLGNSTTAAASGQSRAGTGTEPWTRALELVRFLTFEALEMTHTCCMLEALEGSREVFKITRNCDPTIVRDIRQSEVEKRNAELLDTLMEEFTNVMQKNYHASPLLDFLFGYWKERIEYFYAVREDEVQEMQQHVNNVRTGIWPRPLRRLLWPRPCDVGSEDSGSVHEETGSDEELNDDEH
ncbi:hypothetical protein N0V84_005451 [Fusarium piperis]|uniref:Uncharacterized protein n=1 Tax=Fusarium piperis TaxID=1435070 RepID=A0A9W8WDP4_9HYPO|nr:hypothetical protein N0V84_005451 [Fusarium piperis]